MILYDNMFGDLPSLCIAIGLSAVAALTTLAAVAWWRVRCAAACRPHAVENRAWTYCPKCGWCRPADATGPSLDAPTRPIRDAITKEHATASVAVPLPSVLLRRGWTRQAALDAEGRIVTPCDSSATAFSIWGAGNRAFDPGGDTWREWIRHLTDILTECHGGVSIQQWNRDVGRTHAEVVSVAEEIERRMGLGHNRA